MKTSISTFDFSFIPSGHGHYKVAYTSPVTGKTWSTVTNNMFLVDMVKGNMEAKQAFGCS